MALPNPNLNWSHSTCSMDLLGKALKNKEISAIEVDIVMGYMKPIQSINSSRTSIPTTLSTVSTMTTTEEEEEPDSNTILPIMAHPPLKQSDLTMKHFLYHTTYLKNITSDHSLQRKLKKHIKLDFKEMDTVQPTLDTIKNMHITFSDDKKDNIVFLNADVLPGPAMRHENTPIHAKSFLQLCIDYVDVRYLSLYSFVVDIFHF